MAKSVAADNSLIGLHGKSGEVTDKTARAVNLLRFHIRRQVKEIGAGLDSHDDFFQGGVTSPLADAVDRTLHLPGAPLDSCQAVGNRQSEVVMAVNANDSAVYIRYVFNDALDKLAELYGHSIADPLRDINGGGAGIDNSL